MAFRALRRAPASLSSPFASRAAAAAAPAPFAAARARPFHATPRALVAVGAPVPDLEVLHEGTPGTKVNLAKEFAAVGGGVIVGVPAAFSGACSQKHVPSYIQHPRLRDAGSVFVVSVNDAFV